jgi:nitrate reductase / nitrite oxidoreductase, alpha subunit
MTAPEEDLLRLGRFFRRDAEVSPDLRVVEETGGRDGDVFYRDRWSHDKVVRATHGVNCTGSCSWKVYVKDGIITWESQQTDYPSVGPDSPEYEPRGCPPRRRVLLVHLLPTRVRYPYARGLLVELYREAKARLGDPVAAWADVVGSPGRRRWRSPPPRTCTRSRRTGRTGSSVSRRSRRCRWSRTRWGPGSSSCSAAS